MTSLAAHPLAARRSGPPAAWDGAASWRLDERTWGCRIRGRDGESPFMRAAQALALAVGAAATAGGLALLAPMLSQAAGDTWAMRLGLGALVGGGGLLLLWFASRGTLVEVEVDTARGEVRLVVPNLIGRPTQLGAHGFDAVARVAVSRPLGRRGLATLALELAAGGAIPVATGPEATLAPLRRRLERDLITGVQSLARRAVEAVPEPAFEAVAAAEAGFAEAMDAAFAMPSRRVA